MKIAMPIYFPIPVRGLQIIDGVTAVVKAAGNHVKLELEQNWEADVEAVTLGQSSPSGDHDLIVRVGQNLASESIRPDGLYVSLVVANHDWPGLKHAVLSDPKVRVQVLREFRDKLVIEFAARLRVTPEQIIAKTEACKGSGLSDIRFACAHCGTGFHQNPGSCDHCGAPMGGVLPIY